MEDLFFIEDLFRARCQFKRSYMNKWTSQDAALLKAETLKDIRAAVKMQRKDVLVSLYVLHSRCEPLTLLPKRIIAAAYAISVLRVPIPEPFLQLQLLPWQPIVGDDRQFAFEELFHRMFLLVLQNAARIRDGYATLGAEDLPWRCGDPIARSPYYSRYLEQDEEECVLDELRTRRDVRQVITQFEGALHLYRTSLCSSEHKK